MSALGSGVVLVPVAFDESSQKAVELGKWMADKLGVGLVLVNVYAQPAYFYPGMAPIMFPTIDEEIRQAAERSLGQLARETGASRAIVRAGDPATEILALVDELSPSVVVVGTHGRSGVARFALGSVAEKIVRRSPVPVMTVHAEQAPAG